jgi:hypothetical protein
MRHSVSACLAGLSLLFLLTCLPSGGCKLRGEAQAAELPLRSSLQDSLRKYRRVRVLHSGGAVGEAYRVLLDSLQARSPFRQLLPAEADASLPDDSLSALPLLLMGAPESNPVLDRLLPRLPFAFEGSAFTLGSRRFEGPQQVLQLSLLPNPLRPAMPLAVLTAASDSVLIRFLREVLLAEPWPGLLGGGQGIQLFEGGQRVLAGNFSEAWQAEDSLLRDLRVPAGSARPAGRFRLYPHGSLPGEQAAALAARIERQFAAIEAFTGKPLGDPPIRLHLYAEAELLGLTTLQMEPVLLRHAQQEIHCYGGQGLEGWVHGTENELALRRLLGRPALACLEAGLALRFAPGWQRKGHRFWAACLHRSGDALSLRALADPAAYAAESPLLRRALAAALCDFLIEAWGEAEFLARYARWSPGEAELQALEAPWQDWLRRNAGLHPPQARQQALPYVKALTLAHEGYGITDGYGSGQAREELARIRQTGANLVALVPYSFLRDPRQPAPLSFSQRAGSENDLSVLASFLDARREGLGTLLKPQVWVRGGWPGDVSMRDEAAWEQFHQHYRRWIRHYALLAAMYEMEALCIGVEFAQATQAHPEYWRRLARDLRAIFPGSITYAANWGPEAERIAFADGLDFLGVNCYYPLSTQDSASSGELLEGFRRVAARMEQLSRHVGKDIVFTEIGFRSVSGPWKNPHEEPMGREVNHEHQLRCYRAVLETLRGQAWCKGMVWWKWPSYAAYGLESPDCFSPRDKAAEQILRQAFREWYP